MLLLCDALKRALSLLAARQLGCAVAVWCKPRLRALRLRAPCCIPPALSRTRPDRPPQSVDGVHATGLLHRDIKTANLLFDDLLGLLLSDMGLAEIMDGAGQCYDPQCGTPLYMAPEVALGLPYGKAADW